MASSDIGALHCPPLEYPRFQRKSTLHTIASRKCLQHAIEVQRCHSDKMCGFRKMHCCHANDAFEISSVLSISMFEIKINDIKICFNEIYKTKTTDGCILN